MNNFVYDIPTRVFFGQGQISALTDIVPQYGKKAALVYGGGSIRRNGIYGNVCLLLEQAGVGHVDLSGVEPNPSLETVNRGISLCREEGVDVIVAIGGGSAIDCAKIVAAGVCYDGDPWDLVVNPSLMKAALPIVAVVTIAATGSEMDHIAVITNNATQEKIGTRSPVLRPKAAILDPVFTFTVSARQTASGTADIMSHIMESYFSNISAYLQDRVAEALLKTCIEFGPKALEDPKNYEARANLMWTASWAINDFLKLGKPVQWSVHPIEHQLSAVYDITHGVGLAILTPHWMEYVLSDKTVHKFAQLAANVWSVPPQDDEYAMARAGIAKLKEFLKNLGLPERLGALGIDQTHFQEMGEKAAAQLKGAYVALDAADIVRIYQAAL